MDGTHSCNSCYALATASALEAYYKISKKKHFLWKFSPQQLVDCTDYNETIYTNSGCSAGSACEAMRYI
jgi:hypothetical protein